MSTHDLTHTTDPDGKEVVGIRLSNHHERAWLYRDDYERLVRQFGTPNWNLTGNGSGHFYVRFNRPGVTDRKLSVGRSILGEIEKSAVRCLDGNPLNLRRSNLTFGYGRGGIPSKKAYVPFSLAIPHAGGVRHG